MVMSSAFFRGEPGSQSSGFGQDPIAAMNLFLAAVTASSLSSESEILGGAALGFGGGLGDDDFDIDCDDDDEGGGGSAAFTGLASASTAMTRGMRVMGRGS
jgi:hypothetical protein